MRAVELLEKLVAIDSTSQRSNSEIIELLAEHVRTLGFEIREQSIAEGGVQKSNLIATAGPKPGSTPGAAGLAFVGHTDCVPFDPAWKDALRLTEKDGRFFARGAADTKGFIACALAAVEAVDLARLTRPLSLVFTHDEEIGCLGAKRLAKEQAVRASYAIVGEPTSLTPVYAHKGYCMAEIEVTGREGHSAYPDLGINAIFHAARFLTRIEGISLALKKTRDEAFDPPFTTLNVGKIEGGKAKNMIPGSCKFVVEWRPIPGQDPEAVYEELASAAETLHREDKTFECELELSRADAGVSTPTDGALVRFLEEASGNKPKTVSFGTEAPQMAELGAEPVVFGPGDIKVAHRTGEFVPRADLERATEIFGDAIRRFCIQDS